MKFKWAVIGKQSFWLTRLMRLVFITGKKPMSNRFLAIRDQKVIQYRPN